MRPWPRSGPGRGERPLAERPFVRANCAISLDGRLAYAGGKRAILSGPEDLRRVQALRADSQAIVVGLGTVRLDDPSLRVHWEQLGRSPGPAPMRVVLDSRGELSPEARVLDGSAPTLIATCAGVSRRFPSGIETFAAGDGRVDLGGLLDELGRRGQRRILVEGGSQVLASFLGEGLVDRLTVFVASCIIGGRSAPTMVGGADRSGTPELLRLDRGEAEPLDDGWLLTYRPRGPARRSSGGAPGETALSV